MKIILVKEREDIFLDLARQGAKLPTNYNVKNIITKEEEKPL